MKRFVIIAALVMLVSGVLAGDATGTFYVQLIRGTDTGQPPQPGCRRAGPRVAKTFQPVFKWKYYWEVSLRQTSLRPGDKTRLRLSPDREVEIDLGHPNERRVTTFVSGKETERTISPVSESMTIIGGKRGEQSSWFIVVRRDKPKDYLADN